MHTAEEMGIDDLGDAFPDERYRTAPSRALDPQEGGFYHDGRFPTLRAVVDHYDRLFALGLGDRTSET